MAVTYGFYNALNHDRLYDAIQMSSIFDGIIRDGIFSTIGTSMTVTAPEDGLYVNVGPGRAWFNHTWTLNDTEYPVEAEEAEVVLDRIDAVILEVNSAAEVRANSIKFLKGTPASEPVKPTLTHNAEVNQYALAYVRIRAGQSTIFQADVENAVGTEETPFVTGLMQQVSIENLILQWEAEFDDHFENWRNVNEAEFEVWSQDMQDEYNRWILNQVNTYQTWFAGIQAEAGDDIDEVMAWFQHMKDQISEDAAIRLQEEIDDLALAAEKGSVVTVHTINQTLYGKNCVISQDGQSRTARFDNTGTAVFESIPYVGQVTVTATDGTLTAVTYLTIPYFGRYTTNLAFWAATVNISTQSPEFFSLPIKIFKDNVLIETISFSALGSATYIATSEGTYKFSVTYDNADFDHTIVIDEETTYTVVINDWNATLNMQTSVSELYGRQITISKGGVTVGTTTFNGSGRATYKVHEPGTYHIVTSTAGGDTYQADVVVTEETAYPVDLGLPNGSTVLPTDDIQTWLHCAGINDKGYTTLAEVLEDSVTFNALLGDSNACDYMARSTTFGKAVSAVPVLSSDTGDNGVTFARGMSDGTHCYNIFDNDASTFAYSYYQTASPSFPNDQHYWFGYHFDDPIIIKRMYSDVWNNTAANTTGTFTLQASNDGENWTDVSEPFTLTQNNSSTVHDIRYTDVDTNGVAYAYYRLEETNSAASRPSFQIHSLELLTDTDITDDATAMSILGRYDYACEAVLANPDWAEAIANSEYWESVLDNSTPHMTSNTAPSGVVSASSSQSGYSTYSSVGRLNTMVTTTSSGGDFWHSNDNADAQWLQYQFASPITADFVLFNSFYNTYYDPAITCKNVKLQGSNDGSNWTDLTETLQPENDYIPGSRSGSSSWGYTGKTLMMMVTKNKGAYSYYRVTMDRYDANGYRCSVVRFNIYGRHSSQNLVPLVPTMTSNTTPSGEVIYDATAAGSQSASCYRAFDNDEATWASVVTDDYSDHAWYLGYHFTQPKVVKQVHFTFPSGQPAQTVATLKVQASNDGTTWTDLYTESNVVGGASASKDITLENTTAYSYYRIYGSGAFYRYYNSQVSSYLYMSYIYTLQFYSEREAGVIHSVPNDTVYYLENGVETTLCTCDSNGVGEVDWSELPQGVMTLYSTTAKDILNNHASNDFSMSIRVTPNKVDAWLIPENDNIVYWFGYTKNSLGAKVNTSLNTNTITVSGGGSCAFDKAFDASKFTKMCMYGSGGNYGSHWCMGLAFTSPTSVSSSTRVGGGTPITNELKIHTQTISTTGNVYLGTYVEPNAPTEVIYALWAEEAA